METHLGEKQTITALSRRFSLSPTSLKTGFRRMYGQPIHRWLMEQRMKRACDLLCSTRMTTGRLPWRWGTTASASSTPHSNGIMA